MKDVLWDLAAVFGPLSFGTIGGGSSAIADIHYQVVEVHSWLDETQFVEAFAVSRLAPGPGSLFVALLGWEIAGLPGALVATLALFLPTALMMYGVAAIWSRYRGATFLNAMELGLRPIAAGLILAAVFVLLQSLNGGWAARGLAFVSAAVLMRTRINPILLILSGAGLFLIYDTVLA
ncbi:chromate transporter [Puniceibacterium confluentis]|uniref:chromate transporter n=1 Tax=Puniceibacterium confluentis TaxID=1958944 RepID=UPI0011B4FD03|nr:chromate transporter [Puniceibacterium confluentis]